VWPFFLFPLQCSLVQLTRSMIDAALVVDAWPCTLYYVQECLCNM